MTELHVQPKRSMPWWLWLLIVLIALAILFFLFKGCNNKADTDKVVADTTVSVTKPAAETPIAVTEPDWNNVNFNAPASSYAEVTDPSISVHGNDQYTIYTLGENILFSTDKSTLKEDAENKLKQIAASLNKRFKGAVIGVFGSTDSTGDQGHNKQLGAERAKSVRNWLLQNGSIEENKVSVHSLGESQPISSNATAAGRQQNRNVQIVAFPASKTQQ